MLRKMYCATERIVAINLSRDWKSYSNIEVYYLLFTKTEELMETQSETGHSQNFVLTTTEDEAPLPPQNTGTCAMMILPPRGAFGNLQVRFPGRNHLATCRATARYSSKSIQNQIIALIGDHIRDSIIREIKDVKYFSILCDEVTDNANLEQLWFVLRFVDKDSKIREEFLDFQSTEGLTGEVISELILGKLEQWGLDISHCRGQGYDSASNMSSQARGVQGLISQKNPKALLNMNKSQQADPLPPGPSKTNSNKSNKQKERNKRKKEKYKQKKKQGKLQTNHLNTANQERKNSGPGKFLDQIK
ncbi:hypothetical protein ACROYT_G014641 [Oculina patagonica]